jgi:hypothetical protein
LLLLREKIASINRKFFWQAREKIFVGEAGKAPDYEAFSTNTELFPIAR